MRSHSVIWAGREGTEGWEKGLDGQKIHSEDSKRVEESKKQDYIDKKEEAKRRKKEDEIIEKRELINDILSAW